MAVAVWLALIMILLASFLGVESDGTANGS